MHLDALGPDDLVDFRLCLPDTLSVRTSEGMFAFSAYRYASGFFTR